MLAILKADLIIMRRNFSSMIVAILMPVIFFLLFSAVGLPNDVPADIKKQLVRGFLLTMTSFSLSGFGFFSIPMTLVTERNNNWLKFVEHSPLPIAFYYISKIIVVTILFFIGMVINFTVGITLRDVQLPLTDWVVVTGLLLFGGIVFIAFGLLLSLLQTPQKIASIANVLYFVLAILGGSWMPVSQFPEWLQTISKFTPTYHVNELLLEYTKNHSIPIHSVLVVLFYSILLLAVTLSIKKRQEV